MPLKLRFVAPNIRLAARIAIRTGQFTAEDIKRNAQIAVEVAGRSNPKLKHMAAIYDLPPVEAMLVMLEDYFLYEEHTEDFAWDAVLDKGWPR